MRNRRRLRKRGAIFTIVPLALLALSAAAVALFAFLQVAPTGPVDMKGNPVEVESGVAPDSATVARMNVSEDTGSRLRVPSVGLDVPLGALDMVDNNITPPGYAAAYQVRNLGGVNGTTYIATHSIRGGGIAPGNFLMDAQKGTAAVSAGDVIHVGDTEYVVTHSRTIAKTELAADREVWADNPGTLVLITCLQNDAGKPSTSNLVITAVVRS